MRGWAESVVLRHSIRMRHILCIGLVGCMHWLLSVPCLADVSVKVGHHEVASGFVFDEVTKPSVDDAASRATLTLAAGAADRNSGSLKVLIDGKLPDDADQPSENFFFQPGTDGGRIVVDFGKSLSLSEVSTYSWHPSTRAPQVYTLFVSNGSGEAFDSSPDRGLPPVDCGWRQVAVVDTRNLSKEKEPTANALAGGEYGVTVRANAQELENVRYLLFDIQRTESEDSFGNTFYCEIDAVEANAPALKPIEVDSSKLTRFTTEDGAYRFTIDSKQAPDLTEWASKELVPVVQKWYPAIIQQLPSEGFRARQEVVLKFRNDMGGVPASAAGGMINLNTPWFRRELDREARGAVVHELVHVVQQYDRASRTSRNTVPTPGWIVEGIADYIRWYGYEPESNGAVISRRSAESAKFDASYRVTANFLNWVTENHDKEIVKKLNAAAREGRYDEKIWITSTGKSVEELSVLWKKALAQ